MVAPGPGREPPDLRVLPDPESVSRALATVLVETAGASVAGPFSMALTGGRSAARVYDVLGRNPVSERWSHVHLWWSDERLVPREHQDSNYHDAWHRWLSRVRFPPHRVHHPDVSCSDTSVVAEGYEREIRRHLGPTLAIDCVLLSLGEDGHVASLFPGHPEAVEPGRLVVPVVDSPKPPPRRVTMTLALLGRARQIHIMAVGADKGDALRRALSASSDDADARSPAARLRWSGAPVVWWADPEAASNVEKSSR